MRREDELEDGAQVDVAVEPPGGHGEAPGRSPVLQEMSDAELDAVVSQLRTDKHAILPPAEAGRSGNQLLERLHQGIISLSRAGAATPARQPDPTPPAAAAACPEAPPPVAVAVETPAAPAAAPLTPPVQAASAAPPPPPPAPAVVAVKLPWRHWLTTALVGGGVSGLVVVAGLWFLGSGVHPRGAPPPPPSAPATLPAPAPAAGSTPPASGAAAAPTPSAAVPPPDTLPAGTKAAATRPVAPRPQPASASPGGAASGPVGPSVRSPAARTRPTPVASRPPEGRAAPIPSPARPAAVPATTPGPAPADAAAADALAPGDGDVKARQDGALERSLDEAPADERPPAPGDAPVADEASGAATPLPRSLAQSDIFEVVLRRKGEVLGCIDAHRAELPEPSGRLVVRWTVAPSGRVEDVGTETEALAGTPLARCVEQKVGAWVFPTHQTQGDPVRFPFFY